MLQIVNYVKFERVRRIQFGDELDFRTYGYLNVFARPISSSDVPCSGCQRSCFVSFVLPSMVLAGINNSVVAMNEV